MTLITDHFQTALTIKDDDEHLQETQMPIQLLPNPILEEILSWVPLKTIFCCKAVSKPLHRMLDNPIFARTHFSRAPFCPLLIFHYKSDYKSYRIMYLIEGHTVSELHQAISKSKLISRVDFLSQGSCDSSQNATVISCEGLVCWASSLDLYRHDIIICNPVTGEYVILSSLPAGEDHYNVFIGMGFCKRTDEFVLLRISGKCLDDQFVRILWRLEVRTVGDKCWRQVGDARDEFPGSVSHVVYANGVIYWGDAVSGLFCFNFDTNNLQVIQLPKTRLNFTSKNWSLGLLANSLCVLLVSPDDGNVELWIMEKDGDSQIKWNKLHDIVMKNNGFEHSKCPVGKNKVIKYLRDGEILMYDSKGELVIYNPVTEMETHLSVLHDSFLEDVRLIRLLEFHDVEVVPHVPRLEKLMRVLNMDEDELIQEGKVIGN